VQVLGVDHVIIRVSNYERSQRFYAGLFAFLGFEAIGGFSDMTGWRNGRTAFWIAACDPSTQTKRHRGDEVGLHHYALELGSRNDVDELEAFLKAMTSTSSTRRARITKTIMRSTSWIRTASSSNA